MKKKLILLGVFVMGVIMPFIPTLIIIEMFYLVIPFVLIFIATFIYFIVSIFSKKINRHNSLYIFSILPILILSQLVSGFTVDKIQRGRSDIVIQNIRQIKSKTGNYPEKYDVPIGIEYRKLKNEDNFEISYSRGFMVTEKFNSDNGKWISYGWND